jgi:hypothetical protein
MELYILIFLYNYFIMHDIKYFFLNKINQTILDGAKKNFKENKLPKNIIFQNSEMTDAPLIYTRSALAPCFLCLSFSTSQWCVRMPNFLLFRGSNVILPITSVTYHLNNILHGFASSWALAWNHQYFRSSGYGDIKVYHTFSDYFHMLH